MSWIDGLISGIKVGVVAALPGVGVYKVPAQIVKEAGVEVNRLSETVDQRGEHCKEAKTLMEATPETVGIYIREAKGNRCTVGTDIATNNEWRCGEFLKGYYNWLSDHYIDQSGKIPPPIDPPPIPTPNKGIITIILLFIAGIVALIAVGYSGLGGSAGRIAESEYKKQ